METTARFSRHYPLPTHFGAAGYRAAMRISFDIQGRDDEIRELIQESGLTPAEHALAAFDGYLDGVKYSREHDLDEN